MQAKWFSSYKRTTNEAPIQIAEIGLDDSEEEVRRAPIQKGLDDYEEEVRRRKRSVGFVAPCVNHFFSL